MKLLIVSFVSFFVFFAHAETDFSGTYVGCAKSAAFGGSQMTFHLVKTAKGFGPADVKYSAAFSLSPNIKWVFFPEVLISESQRDLLMNTEILPKLDHGQIINSISVRIETDGSFSGVYLTNATIADGDLMNATWTARKIADGQRPKSVNLNCK